MSSSRSSLSAWVCGYAITISAAACATSSDAADEPPGAEGCPVRPLAEFCVGACPSDEAAAIERICSRSGAKHWTESINDCGGRSIGSATGYTGATYAFDKTHSFVAGYSWSDLMDEDDCPSFTDNYGRVCKQNAPELRPCPGVEE
jgi:hypothetical protein